MCYIVEGLQNKVPGIVYTPTVQEEGYRPPVQHHPARVPYAASLHVALQSTSRLAISWLHQTTYRLTLVSWLAAPAD